MQLIPRPSPFLTAILFFVANLSSKVYCNTQTWENENVQSVRTRNLGSNSSSTQELTSITDLKASQLNTSTSDVGSSYLPFFMTLDLLPFQVMLKFPLAQSISNINYPLFYEILDNHITQYFMEQYYYGEFRYINITVTPNRDNQDRSNGIVSLYVIGNITVSGLPPPTMIREIQREAFTRGSYDKFFLNLKSSYDTIFQQLLDLEVSFIAWDNSASSQAMFPWLYIVISLAAVLVILFIGPKILIPLLTGGKEGKETSEKEGPSFVRSLSGFEIESNSVISDLTGSFSKHLGKSNSVVSELTGTYSKQWDMWINSMSRRQMETKVKKPHCVEELDVTKDDATTDDCTQWSSSRASIGPSDESNGCGNVQGDDDESRPGKREVLSKSTRKNLVSTYTELISTLVALDDTATTQSNPLGKE